jgi:hypothetical protein
MSEKEPRPVVNASEDGGIWHLTVTPPTAIRGLRDCIDAKRNVGLNFASGNCSPNYVNVSVAPQQERAFFGALEKFGDIVIDHQAA